MDQRGWGTPGLHFGEEEKEKAWHRHRQDHLLAHSQLHAHSAAEVCSQLPKLVEAAMGSPTSQSPPANRDVDASELESLKCEVARLRSVMALMHTQLTKLCENAVVHLPVP